MHYYLDQQQSVSTVCYCEPNIAIMSTATSQAVFILPIQPLLGRKMKYRKGLEDTISTG